MTPRAERTQKIKTNFKKLEKIWEISIELSVFSNRLFVSSHVRGGGGGAPRANGEGDGGNSPLGWRATCLSRF